MTGTRKRITTTWALVVAFLTVAFLLPPGPAYAVWGVNDGDTYISNASNNAKGSNFGLATSLKVGAGQYTILRYDFSGIPAGTTGAGIQKATLNFFVDSIGGVSATFNVQRVNAVQNWNETTVTFNNFGTPWDPALIASGVQVGGGDVNNFVSID